MAREPIRPGEWRYWLGTMMMAAAVVLLASALVNPPSDDEPTAYLVGYYVGGIVFLAVGWWLRARSRRD